MRPRGRNANAVAPHLGSPLTPTTGDDTPLYPLSVLVGTTKT